MAVSKTKYLLFAPLALSLLIIAIFPSCRNQSTANHAYEVKAAIVDQLYFIQPNPEFIERTTEILEAHGFKVDVWQGKEVTVKFYRELPQYGYQLILFRAHLGILSLVGDSKVIPMEITSLFTGETYTTTKYVAEQLKGVVHQAQMTNDYRSIFGISPKFVADSMRGVFDDTAIIMMGCSSHYLDDMAIAFVEKGASVYLGWSATVTLDYLDGATLNLIDKLFLNGSSIKQATVQTMADVGRDPYYHARLKYFPAQSGSQTIRELIKRRIKQPPSTPLVRIMSNE